MDRNLALGGITLANETELGLEALRARISLPAPPYPLWGIAGNTGDAHGAPTVFTIDAILQG